ncbi:MAG: ABC transporter ATP-binding protein [Synechococcaceae cyanobacterium RL_1_2]|nr:ABC transporter ATP-binding protein [Synechococcaceae cyanobacterium RL_1_2]
MDQTTALESTDRDFSAPNLDVELRQVYKIFNGETAVSGINLQINQGEFFSILGPSGCGKTTTLRLIAGFEAPSAGEVLIQANNVNEVPSYRRPVNTVFQSYALFGHLTVAENIAFGLKIKNLPKSEIRQRVHEALVGVKMETYANRFPAQLSGGQQQRVALARALVNKPAVVLLDEPLGALDLKLRKEMQVELSRLHQELGLTFVMVTHDQEEALSLSDRIAVMRKGRIEQIGTPNEIYEQPISPFVADFIGDANLFDGYVEQSDSQQLQVITPKGWQILVGPKQEPFRPEGWKHQEVVVSVRPESIRLSGEMPNQIFNVYEGKLLHTMYMGTYVQFVIELGTGEMITVTEPTGTPAAAIKRGETVFISWLTTDCIALKN